MALYLTLQHLPKNLPEFGNPAAPWGRLELYLDDGLDRTELLSVEWHLGYFITWYLNSHLPMLRDRFALFNRKDGQSISEFMEEPLTRQRRDYQNFLHAHSFVSTMNIFTALPKIMVALDKEPHLGEVSLSEKFHNENHPPELKYLAPKWAYPFDIRQYRHDSRFEVIRFLEDWQDIAPQSMKRRALSLFRQALDSPE